MSRSRPNPPAPGVDGALLRTNGLVKRFGGVRAIDGIDLEVGPQELRCIIGPNGAGKSTLFKLLFAIERPDAGRIYFAGRDISRVPTYQRALLGMAIKYQSLGVYQNLSVEHNLFVAINRRLGQRREVEHRIEALLAELNLAESSSAPARELSHGARQWLEMGMALATEPMLLLLDEPTAGMSGAETRTTADIVRRVTERGVAVLVIEHDMAFVRELNGRVTVLHQGRVFADGSYAEIEADEHVREIYLGRYEHERPPVLAETKTPGKTGDVP